MVMTSQKKNSTLDIWLQFYILKLRLSEVIVGNVSKLPFLVSNSETFRTFLT